MSWSVDTVLERLDREGYAHIEAVVPQDAVRSLLAGIKGLAESRAPTDQAGTPYLNRGHGVVYNLQREDVAYARVITGDDKLMAVLRALLNDVWYRQIPQDKSNFLLRSMLGRSSGGGVLPLHIDSFIPSSGRTVFACQISVVLEDQNEANGCTLVVPGSHRSDTYASQEAMKDAVPLPSKAGDVVIWDSRLWHGALGNTSGASRWALIATFVRWWMKQNYDITGQLPQAIYEALTDEEKAIFGYCSRPPRDEYERTDMKTGFADLKPRVEDYAL